MQSTRLSRKPQLLFSRSLLSSRSHLTSQTAKNSVRRATTHAAAPPTTHPITNTTLPTPTTLPSSRKKRSLFSRLLRGTLLSTLFFTTGFLTVQAIITLPYLYKSATRTPDSEPDLKLHESINHKLDSSPLVQQLRKDQGWVEDAAFDALSQTKRKDSRHLVHETLPRPGVRGLATRVFRRPESKVSLVVVHVGPGCESWPQFAHGGVTTTLLVEAVENHLLYFYSGRAVLTEQDVTVKFKAPVRTHGIYAITVSPVMDRSEDGRSFVRLEAQFDRLALPPRIVERVESGTDTKSTTEIQKLDAQTLAAASIRMPSVD